MSELKTPYDGSSKLFQIGLKPLDPADWIDVDAHLAAHLAEKQRLFAAHPGEIMLAEPGTEAAQAEILALLAEHLPSRFPQHYRHTGSGIDILPSAQHIVLDAPGVLPLWTAASLVQEDLLLMRKGEAGWHLAAGALAFPSSWSLREKLGRPMHEIHAPVPGFGPQTRNAMMIERMFDHLRPETPVIRWNWSLYGDDRLHHPESAHPDRPRFGPGARAESVFLRVERQTLRRLPVSRDILFTVRIYVDPIAKLEKHPTAVDIATALIEQLLALDAAQLDYKGLTLERDKLVARLEEMTGH